MRLLLLLSAILAALSGVGGTRASAQPVQASASAITSAPRMATVARSSIRFAAPAYAALPPLRLDLPRLVSAGTARLLYAERRRE